MALFRLNSLQINKEFEEREQGIHVHQTGNLFCSNRELATALQGTITR